MTDYDRLPEGWGVWNDEPGGRSILVYRPDVFDGSAYPAACLPTLYISPRNPRDRRPDAPVTGRWHVACFLEPEVRVRECDRTVDTRADAIREAVAVARAFDDGDVDYRAAYQLPREEYLDRLDDLTGREP